MSSSQDIRDVRARAVLGERVGGPGEHAQRHQHAVQRMLRDPPAPTFCWFVLVVESIRCV